MGASRRAPSDRSPSCTRSTTSRRRRRSADGERVYAWFGNGQLVALDLRRAAGLDAPSRRRVRAVRRAVGPRQLAGALSRSRHPALRSPHRRRTCWRSTRKTGSERWKVARGSGRVSHSTPVVIPGPKGDELLVNSSARIDAYDPATGAAALVHRHRAADADPVGGVPRRPHLPEPRLPQQRRAGDPAGRPRRRHRDARRLDGAERRLLRAVDRPLRRPALHDQRGRHRDLRRRRDRRARVAASARRRLLRVAGGRRRQDLFRQRDRRDVRAQGRADAGGAGDERSRRALPRLARDRRAAGSSSAPIARCSPSADDSGVVAAASETAARCASVSGIWSDHLLAPSAAAAADARRRRSAAHQTKAPLPPLPAPLGIPAPAPATARAVRAAADRAGRHRGAALSARARRCSRPIACARPRPTT